MKTNNEIDRTIAMSEEQITALRVAWEMAAEIAEALEARGSDGAAQARGLANEAWERFLAIES